MGSRPHVGEVVTNSSVTRGFQAGSHRTMSGLRADTHTQHQQSTDSQGI